jgi:hypothetical protein
LKKTLDKHPKKGYTMTMKKIISGLVLVVLAGSASAQWGRHHHHHYNGGNSYGWVAPALIGGIIGYELSRPNVVVQQPPVVVQQPQVYTDTNTVVINGLLYRKQYITTVDGVTQEVLVRQ